MTPTISPELIAKIEQEARSSAANFHYYPGSEAFEDLESAYETAAKKYALKWEQAEQKIDKLTDILDEARLQIEYLHKKYGEKGSGNNILARIETALTDNESIRQKDENIKGTN